MSQPEYDAIVVGLGAMGAAAAYQLARRGARVLGIDRFSPPHEMGSSHGETRITRLAIGEGAHYTPLAMRSHEIWREIERESGAELLTTCGGLFISSANKVAITHVEGFFRNTVAAAEKFAIPHEVLDAGAIRSRYPQFAVADDEFGYFEPSAGFVRPEACVAAQLALAEKHGAEIRRNETVLSLDSGVTTDKGTYASDNIVVAAGAWLPALLGYGNLFKVHRQVQFWFEAPGAQYRPRAFPAFIWELPKGRQGIYGFPSLDGASLKVATERYESTTAPDAVARDIGADEAASMRDLIAPYLPGVGPGVVRASTCLYTVTPDNGFVIDRVGRLILASPCSGHGFKHSAAIGEVLAGQICGEAPRFDLAPFRISRFAS